MADPAGSVSGVVALVAELKITLPSTNGANPGRNLCIVWRKKQAAYKN